MKHDRDATLEDYDALRFQKYYELNEQRRWEDRVDDIMQWNPLTVCEIGCGRGLFVRHLAANTRTGYVLGIDPVAHDSWENCGVFGYQYGTADAWPEWQAWMVNVDVTCSFDVLEHIPQDKVAMSIAGIAERTKKASYHNIYNGDDIRVINRKRVQMHLTQQPAEWWADQFSRHMGGTVTILPCTHLPKFRFGIEVVL